MGRNQVILLLRQIATEAHQLWAAVFKPSGILHFDVHFRFHVLGAVIAQVISNGV